MATNDDNIIAIKMRDRTADIMNAIAAMASICSDFQPFLSLSSKNIYRLVTSFASCSRVSRKRLWCVLWS